MRDIVKIKPKVPTSNPEENREVCNDDEKSDATKNITGKDKTDNIILSFGIKNLPSISLAINQKKTEAITPIEIRNPLLASAVTEEYGTKKNTDNNKDPTKEKKDNLFIRLTFFDSIV
ncbi:MAG: hypothetical protein WC089_00080 [Candidatus Paceibacterota bacterium]